MRPVILAVSLSKITIATFDELVRKSSEATISAATAGQAIYAYVYNMDVASAKIFDENSSLEFKIQSHTSLTGVFASLGFGSVMELKVIVPSAQDITQKRLGKLYGPVRFTKIQVVDTRNGNSINLWPLCIMMNVPVILGVTQEAVISGTTNNPADVYKDLLKKNLTNLIKGTRPGSVRRGSALEDPPPDVYIYGCNFTLPKVKPADILSVDRLFYSKQRQYPRKICTVGFDFSIGPLNKKFQFDLQEIGVALPAMADLQDSVNYVRNAILMAFSVQVVNDAGNGELSNIWHWPMWLPMPVIEERFPKNKQYGNGIYLGNENSRNDHGEIRWYLGNPEITQRRPFDKYVQGVADELQKIRNIPFDKLSEAWNFTAATKTIVLPREVVEILSDIRDAGELCEIDRTYNFPWVDDTVWFNPPFESCYKCTCGYVYDPEAGDLDHRIEPWTGFKNLPDDWVCPQCGGSKGQFTKTDTERRLNTGFAVVWRGDIPSLPLPINLMEYAKELARRLWRPVYGIGMGDYDIPIVIPVGEAIQFGVERLEDTINNELAQHIGVRGGLEVKFAFLADAPDGSTFDENSITEENNPNSRPLCIGKSVSDADYSAVDPGHKGIDISKIVKFKYIPRVTSKDLTADESGAFTLQLSVLISGDVTLLGHKIHIGPTRINIGPKLRFHPQPLKIPTVAIFFVDRYFENRALVALPSSTGQSPIKIDAQVQDDMGINQTRFRIINELGRINDLLEKFNWFAHIPELDRITDVVGKICNIGGSLISVTSNGSIVDLREYCLAKPDLVGLGGASFSNCISSAVIIGPPYEYSLTKVICWELPLSVSEASRGRRLELPIPDGQFIRTVDDFRYVSTIPEVIEGTGFGPPNGFNDAVNGIEFKAD